MDFVDILVLMLLIAAAVAAYVLYAIRGGARVPREPAIPRLAGLKLKPLTEPAPSASGARSSSESAVSPPSPPPAAALFDVDSEPPPAAAPTGEIRWCMRFDSRSETLDDTARLRLIGDLGVVAKEWCVPLLAQAYQEEQRSSHRQAALTSLAACHSRAAAGTFRAALAAADPAERAIAADGLADLEPAQQAKVRRTVERF
jgi:hypothetical protein